MSRLSERNINFESFHFEMATLIDELAEIFGADNLGKEDASASLTTIFSKARGFDIMRRKMQADITIQVGQMQNDGSFMMNGFALDVEVMKNITPRNMRRSTIQNPAVILCVSPALLRRGDSDGANYDCQEVLSEMRVLCEMEESSNRQQPQAQAEQEDSQALLSDHKTPGNNIVQHTEIEAAEPDELIQEDNSSDDLPTNRLVKKEVKVKIGITEAVQSAGIDRADISSSRVPQTPPMPVSTGDCDGSTGRGSRPVRAGSKRKNYAEDDGSESSDPLAKTDEEKSSTAPRPAKKYKGNTPRIQNEDDDYKP